MTEPSVAITIEEVAQPQSIETKEERKYRLELERKRRYYHNHPEKFRTYQAKWRGSNRELYNANALAYYHKKKAEKANQLAMDTPAISVAF